MNDLNDLNDHDDHVDLAAFLGDDVGAGGDTADEAHLASCAECRDELATLREFEDMLRAVPPEARLDGPPEHAEMLLARTVREVRAGQSRPSGLHLLHGSVGFVAAAAVAVAALTGGIAIGHQSGPAGQPVAAAPNLAPAPEVPGTRFASAVDPGSGTRMTVRITPAAGWVRVNAAVTGVPAGESCQLIVVAADGRQEVAGSWLVSAAAEKAGVTLDGSAVVDPTAVRAVLVRNTAGRQFAEVTV